jgi:excinuclease UvrABC nuclease subunit
VPDRAGSSFVFEETVAFDPADAEAALASIPARAGVFGLYGARETDEPYLTRCANLQRRIRRMLQPLQGVTKRLGVLNLREKVVHITYTVTGSELESLLTLYHATAAGFGRDAARRRMRLHTPFFVRFAMENAYPRAYVTNRLSRRALNMFFGPYPSRAAADRALNEVLNLFKLRRCVEELAPDPSHPGCVYSEMKMCLAPCFKGCSDERYAEEAHAVFEFFRTHGESMLAKLAAERSAASAAMEFEQAAAVHEKIVKAKAAAQCSDEIVRPLTQLNAVIVLPAAGALAIDCDEVALFAVQRGCIEHSTLFSTLGMRHANEDSGSTSLFAQPHMLAAVPLDEKGEAALAAPIEAIPIETTEERLKRALAELMTPEMAERADEDQMAELSDHLSLLRRWYYRPSKQRVGEIFFAEAAAGSGLPVRRILRGISRVCVKAAPAAPPDKITQSHPEAALDLDKDSPVD